MSHPRSRQNKPALKSVVSPLASLAIVWNYSKPSWSHIVRRWYLVRDWSQPPLKKNECPWPPMSRMPSPVTPETILETAPKKTRVLRVDANVVAYFGDLLSAMRKGLSEGLVNSVRTGQSNTASAQNLS